MLDFFSIFTKGGIVLWCFQGTAAALSLTPAVNALIKTVILQVNATPGQTILCQLCCDHFFFIGTSWFRV